MKSAPVVRLAVGMVASALAQDAWAGCKDFDVTFSGCAEFAGIGFVPAANARALMPAGYTLAGDTIDAIVVARVSRCDAISVDGHAPTAGTVSQIGITIVGPDGDADIDNYTVWYVTDVGLLHGKLRSAGLPTDNDSGLSFSFSNGALDIEATPPQAPEHEIHGTAVSPTAPAVPFVARWWSDVPHGTVLMRTEFPAIQFGGSTMTLTTPAGSDLADLIGDTSLTFGILDSYNTFPEATMEVTVD